MQARRRSNALIIIVLAITATTGVLLLRDGMFSPSLSSHHYNVNVEQGVSVGVGVGVGNSRQLLLGISINANDNGYAADPRTTADEANAEAATDFDNSNKRLVGSDTSLMTWAWSPSPYQCHGPFPIKKYHDGNHRQMIRNGAIANSKTEGMLFVKPMKTGSSTASGVQMQIARNMARRLRARLDDEPASSALPTDDGIGQERLYCRNSIGIDHEHEQGIRFAARKKDRSFLWTILREPTKRASSHYFWSKLTTFEPDYKHHKMYTDDEFKRFLEGSTTSDNPINYYLHHHTTDQESLRRLDMSIGEMSIKGNGKKKQQKRVKRPLDPALAFHDYRDIGNNIMSNYDFIAITERFDESMVVLSMLMNIPLGDMLYLPSEESGNHLLTDCSSDGPLSCKCIDNQHPFVTPEMDMYLSDTNPESILQKEGYPYTWEERIRWDKAMYDAANISLDRTINEVLGQDVFVEQLDLYKRALALVNERCAEGARTSCSPDGNMIFPAVKVKCLQGDWLCGYDCVERVAAELNLL